MCCSVLQCVAVCCSVLQCVAVCCSVLQRPTAFIWRYVYVNRGEMHTKVNDSHIPFTHTGWRRLIGSRKLQIIFHKRAIKYRSLLRKMIYIIRDPMSLRHPVRLFTPWCIHTYESSVAWIVCDVIRYDHVWRDLCVTRVPHAYTCQWKHICNMFMWIVVCVCKHAFASLYLYVIRVHVYTTTSSRTRARTHTHTHIHTHTYNHMFLCVWQNISICTFVHV